MERLIFGLAACDACRKARKALPEARLVDVREEGVPGAVLEAALAEFGAALVNTRSTTWRGLSPEARALPPAELLRAHPAVMKRPLIALGDRLFLGWTPAVEAAVRAES